MNDGLTEAVTDLLEHVGVEVKIRMLSEVSPAERGLKGVAILDTKLTPDDHSCCGFLRLLDSKGTVAKAKCVCLPFKNVRKDPLFELVILWYRVPVYINLNINSYT